MERNDLARLDIHAFRATAYPKPAITLAISNTKLRAASSSRSGSLCQAVGSSWMERRLSLTERYRRSSSSSWWICYCFSGIPVSTMPVIAR